MIKYRLADNPVQVNLTEDDEVEIILRDPENPGRTIAFVATPEQATAFGHAVSWDAVHASNRAAFKLMHPSVPSHA